MDRPLQTNNSSSTVYSYRIEDGVVIELEEKEEVEIVANKSPSNRSGTDTDAHGDVNESTNNTGLSKPKKKSSDKKKNSFHSIFSKKKKNGRREASKSSSATAGATTSHVHTKAENDRVTINSDEDDSDHDIIKAGSDEVTIVDMPSPIDIIGEQEIIKNVGKLNPSKKPGMNSQCRESLYGYPLPAAELEKHFDANIDEEKKKNYGEEDGGEEELLMQDGGLIWYSSLVPNDFDKDFKLNGSLKMLPQKFYDEENESIKPRRGTLNVKEDDFFKSLVKIDINPQNHSHDGDNYDDGQASDYEDFDIFSKNAIFEDGNGKDVVKKQHSRWFFSGVLNGFPGLKHLELLKIEYKLVVVPGWKTHWRSYNNPQDLQPSYPKSVPGMIDVRAKLREPGWSAEGWSKDSPGYVFYYQPPETRTEPRILYGTNIIKQFEDERLQQVNKFVFRNQLQPSPKCVQVHMISHRYAVLNEKWKVRIISFSMS